MQLLIKLFSFMQVLLFVDAQTLIFNLIKRLYCYTCYADSVELPSFLLFYMYIGIQK